MLYAEGRGVPPDPDRALFLFGWACESGNALGCRRYEEGFDRERGRGDSPAFCE